MGNLYKAGKRGGTERNSENERIEMLYFDYRLKKPDADFALINHMWQYVDPIYQTIIYGTMYPAKNRMWVQFLRNYMRYDFQGVLNLEICGEGSKYGTHVAWAVENVRKLFKGISKEELKHIMNVTIWDLARSYSHRGTPNFLLYFSMYYTHRFQSFIKPMIKDDVYYKTVAGYREPLRQYVLLYDEDYTSAESYTDWYDDLYIGEDKHQQLGTDWVMGYSADIFENLSRYDRQIVKWLYVDNLSVAAIGERLGLTSRTVDRYLADIRERLEAELLDKHLLSNESKREKQHRCKCVDGKRKIGRGKKKLL